MPIGGPRKTLLTYRSSRRGQASESDWFGLSHGVSIVVYQTLDNLILHYPRNTFCCHQYFNTMLIKQKINIKQYFQTVTRSDTGLAFNMIRHGGVFGWPLPEWSSTSWQYLQRDIPNVDIGQDAADHSGSGHPNASTTSDHIKFKTGVCETKFIYNS